jgi:hypothetical protein
MANLGKGFGRTVDRSERHHHTSWGRTRCPKNIINTDHTNPSSVVLIGTAGGGGDVKTSAAYITENQRFLHISHIAAVAGGSACSIQVQAFMHASGVWANFGSAIACAAARVHSILEITGVDQIRFVVSNLADTETCTIFPACSTF